MLLLADRVIRPSEEGPGPLLPVSTTATSLKTDDLTVVLPAEATEVDPVVVTVVVSHCPSLNWKEVKC